MEAARTFVEQQPGASLWRDPEQPTVLRIQNDPPTRAALALVPGDWAALINGRFVKEARVA